MQRQEGSNAGLRGAAGTAGLALCFVFLWSVWQRVRTRHKSGWQRQGPAMADGRIRTASGSVPRGVGSGVVPRLCSELGPQTQLAS